MDFASFQMPASPQVCAPTREIGSGQFDLRDYDDGDGTGGFLGRQCCHAVARHQNIHLETDKLRHQVGYWLTTPIGVADFNCDRFTFHVAQLSELLPESPELR